MGREEVPFQLQGTASNFPSPPNSSLINKGKNEKRKMTCRRYGLAMSTAKNNCSGNLPNFTSLLFYINSRQ